MESPSRGVADPLRRAWGPVTIRVVWELLRAGVNPKGTTLRVAREHALLRVGAGLPLEECESRAAASVAELLARAEGVYPERVDDPDWAIALRPEWRQAVLDAGEPVHDAVFRLHFADGEDLDELEARTRLDRVVLKGAREAVRAIARDVLRDGGVDVDGWEGSRFDRLLGRLANTAGETCPGPGGLATEMGKAHADRCPRCARALRLFREGVLTPNDLFPPEDGPCVAPSTWDAAAIVVHPDGRRHLNALHRALAAAGPAGAVSRLADDTLLVDVTALDPAPVLVGAAERAAPRREHLRALRRRVSGRWTRVAPVGAGVDELLAGVRGVPWGDAAGLVELPEPLPPPPSAARVWAAAFLVAMLAVAAAVWALADAPRSGLPLEVRADAAGVSFDTDDEALVWVVAVGEGGHVVVFDSENLGDKARLATGDGRFRLDSGVRSHVVVASMSALPDLGSVVAAGAATESAAGLAERLSTRYPDASVAVAGGTR